MLDEALLAGIRRFWTRDQVVCAYQEILSAYQARLSKKVIIIGKATEGESSSAQVVVQATDYRDWMEALEARLQELDREARGVSSGLEGTEHVNFGCRYLRT